MAEIELKETILSNVRKQIAARAIEADYFKVIKVDGTQSLILEDKFAELPR
jgi:hypothetical protein